MPLAKGSKGHANPNIAGFAPLLYPGAHPPGRLLVLACAMLAPVNPCPLLVFLAHRQAPSCRGHRQALLCFLALVPPCRPPTHRTAPGSLTLYIHFRGQRSRGTCPPNYRRASPTSSHIRREDPSVPPGGLPCAPRECPPLPFTLMVSVIPSPGSKLQ